jgi:GNAT superfamily N-acetyltransferase
LVEEAALDVQIRRATVLDAAEIALLLRDIGYFSHINSEAPQATEERVARHLGMCAADDSHSIYVAEDGQGSVLGYGAVHWLPYLILPGPEGYISELFVRGSARGQGIGGRLLQTIQSEAQKLGCARLMLLNRRSRESYQRQFYLKHGWEERSEMADFVYNFPNNET